MNTRIILIIISAILLAFLGKLQSQDPEKSLSHTAMLIDAIKEQQIGNNEKAIQILEKIRFEPEVGATVNYQLARLYNETARHEDALLAIRESIRLDPFNKWSLTFEANLLENLGRHCQAAETYLALSALEKGNYTFYDNSALNYLKCNEVEKSIQVLEQAQSMFGLLPPLALRKAWVFQSAKKYKKAIEILESCFHEFPKHEELLPPLIELYLNNNRVADAEKSLNILRSLHAKHPYLKKNTHPTTDTINLTNLQMEISSLELGLDEKINLIVAALNVSSSKENINLLIPLAATLTQSHPSEAKTWALLADLYYQAAQYEIAEKYYIQATEKGTVPYMLWENLLYCLLQQSKSLSLEKYSNKALDYYPNQAFLYYTIAQAQLLNENYGQALDNANHLILMSQHNVPKKTEAIVLKSKILLALGNLTEAKENWKALMNFPKNAFLEIEENLFKAEINESPSEKNFLDALALSPLSPFAKNVKEAEFRFFTKEYSAAKNVIDTILIAASPNATIYVLAGKVYAKLGLNPEAKKYFEKALSLSEYKRAIEKLIQTLP